MDMIMVYLIVRGLGSISFDKLFTYCDLSKNLMVMNFTRIIVFLMLESILFSEDY